MSDLDYVELYAQRLREDGRVFEQQRRFIEAQLEASKSLFGRMFAQEEFKERAREFLAGRGLLREQIKKGI